MPLSWIVLFSMALFLFIFHLPILVDSADDINKANRSIQEGMISTGAAQNLPGIGRGSIRNSNPPASGSIRTPPAGSIRTGTGSIRTAPTGTGSIRTANTVAPSSGSIRTPPTDGVGGGSIRTTGGGSIRNLCSCVEKSLQQQTTRSSSRGSAAEPYICPYAFHLPPEEMEWIFSDTCPQMYKRNKDYMEKGSHGEVHHGYSYKTKKCVAVKETSLYGYNADFESIAHAEIEILEMLSHYNFQHIIQMEYSCKEDYLVTVVMELAEKTLEKYWTDFLSANKGKEEKFIVNEAKQIILELLTGVNDLHNKAHVIHSDLRVYNIMFMPASRGQSHHRGPLKIIDFGNALKVDETDIREGTFIKFAHTSYKAISVIQNYSPDQYVSYWDKTKVSSKSDIWAIGSIVFWMLSGINRHPENELVSTRQLFYEDSKKTILESAKAYNQLRHLFIQSQRIKTPLIAPLLYMAWSCADLDPKKRPSIEDLLNYMRADYALPVSSQFYKIPTVAEADKTYKMMENGASLPWE